MPTITFGAATGDPIICQRLHRGNFPGSSTTTRPTRPLYPASPAAFRPSPRRWCWMKRPNSTAPPRPSTATASASTAASCRTHGALRRNLTINLGLRYEKQGEYENLNDLYTRVGYRPVGPLRRRQPLPARYLTGVTPPSCRRTGDPYNTPAAWAPSVGVGLAGAGNEGILGKIFGSHEGASVLRAGYSISTVREGQNLFISVWGATRASRRRVGQQLTTLRPTSARPAASSSAMQPADELRPVQYAVLSDPGVTSPPALNDFAPNLKMGYVQSWNIGWQRELGRNTVVEVRYTGNHGVHLWRQYNLNEVNIVENGFLNEFMVAQNNLRIARGGDITKNTTMNNWGNTGLAGQVATPILQTAIGDTTDTTIAQLLLGQAGGAANAIATNSGRMAT